MKKHNDLLNTLNALRAQLNKKALTEFKGTEAEIKTAIATAKKNVKERVAQDKANAEDNAPKITNSQKGDLVAMAKAVKAKAKTPKAKAQADAIITKASAKGDNKAEGKTDRFLGVAPKIARAKLRKAFGSDWKNKTASEIAAVLKPTK